VPLTWAITRWISRPSCISGGMFSALRDQIDPTIAAISTLLIVLSIVLLGLSQLFGRKRSPGS
jgi:ABC-type spermidine/putrescine transport system permease subunit II